MRALVNQSIVVLAASCAIGLFSCQHQADSRKESSMELFSIFNAKADSLKWQHPLRIGNPLSQEWDCMYVVEWHHSAIGLPANVWDVVEADDDAEDYVYFIFTHHESIAEVIRISNYIGRITSVICGQHIDCFSHSDQIYFVHCGSPPYEWIGMYSSNCDSSEVFRYRP
jgi:hypothetical protein